MGTKPYAIRVDEEMIAKFDSILEKMAFAGEQKGDTFARIFKIAEEQMDSETLKAGGADVEGLDAALSHLRSLYVALVGTRQELITVYEEKMAKIKEAKDKAETAFLEQLSAVKSELAESAARMNEASSIADMARKDMDNAIAQAKAQGELAEATKKTNDMLISELTAAKEQLTEYASLKAIEADLREKLAEANRNIEEVKKEASRASEEAEKALANAIEKEKAAADLSLEKALSKAEKEHDRELRERDKIIAKLEAQVELLQGQLNNK